MEIHVHPQGFGCLPAKLPKPDGTEADAVRVVLVDASGITVHAFFVAESFEQFKKFLADPEGETARQQARAKIVAPNGPVRMPKH